MIVVAVAVVVGGWALTSHLVASANALPEGVAARVGDTDITQEQFEIQQRLVRYQRTIALVGAQGFQKADLHLVPLQEDPEVCASWVREYASEETLAAASDEQLRDACTSAASGLHDDTLAQLLSARLTEASASALDVEVDEAAFDARVEQFTTVIGGEDQLGTLESAAGITDTDVRQRLRESLLEEAVRAKVKSDTDTSSATEAEQRRYYDENPGAFVAEPETRDAGYIVADTEEAATEARQRIEAGDSFETVAADLPKELSKEADPASGDHSGLRFSELSSGLGQLVFAAETGVLGEVTRIEEGWAVVRVDGITPRRDLTFEQAQEEHGDQLEKVAAAEKPDWAWQAYQEQTRAEWLPQIRCAPEHYVEGYCGA
ncbi:peptidyl-prolyl cis-trans isomerase [Leucobacter weissii]|uniref:Peptidyl-prolyl cis-trans isomerase n=1 Tax=Leucobacter weissii TaxID=1983706 RepID=A0A939SBT4_9MICO|nr:peptidyl-prolyl cis-trans isomerase [Leucobacter weissii]